MANNTYDPEADQEREPVRQTGNPVNNNSVGGGGASSGIGSNSSSTKQGRTSYSNGSPKGGGGASGPYSQSVGGGAGLDAVRGSEAGGDSFYNSDGDEDESGGGTGNLRKSEQSPGQAASAGRINGGPGSGPGYSPGSGTGSNPDSLYNEAGDEPKGRIGQARAKIQETKSNFRKATSNKWFLGIGVGTSGVAIVIVVLVLMMGTMKIPHVMENITAYQFARVTRQMSITSRNIVTEKMAIDAADDGTWNKIKATYSSTTGKAKDLHDKITKKLVPGKIAANYDQAGHFKPIYSGGGVIRGPKLVGVQLDNQTYRIQETTGFKRFIPGVSFANQAKNAATLAPYLNESMKLDNLGTLIRGREMTVMRKALGINLVAWKIGKYSGQNPDKERLQQARDLYNAAKEEQSSKAKTEAIRKAGIEARQQLKNNVSKDPALTRILNNRGVDPAIIEKIQTTFSASTGLFQGLASFISPVYSVAVPVCLIYDNSIVNNGESMDAQSKQVRKLYNYGQTAAAQQRRGDTTSAAVGALSDQLGAVEDSTSEKRASGIPVNTAGYNSTQASPTGEFTIFDALSPSSAAGDFVNLAADNICPIATNVGVGIGLGALNIAACFNPIGGTQACLGEQAAKKGAESFLVRASAKALSKLGADETKSRALGGIIRQGVISTGKTAALTVGGIFVAQSVTASQAGLDHNGLQQDGDLVDDMDNGASQDASAFSQPMFGGRPLTDDEMRQVREQDNQDKEARLQSESAFDRYANIYQADSLVSRLAMMASSSLNGGIFSSLVKGGASLFNPFSSAKGVFGTLIMGSANAASPHTSRDTDYGNVALGYSVDELKLLANDPSFKPLPNQKILDDSGMEDQIAAKYAVCTGAQDSKSISELIADTYVIRTPEGDVQRDKGLCSPNNLGYNNTSDPIAVDNSPDTRFHNDLVFRWRVAVGYNHALDELIDRQTIETDSDAETDTGDSSLTVSGNAQEIAQQIKDNPNISYAYSAGEDIDLAAKDPQAKGTNGVPIDIRLLQIVAAIGRNHKIVVTAFESHGQGHSDGSAHYSGKAVDIDTIDGVEAYTSITDYWTDISEYAKGAEFLQGDCSGAKPAPSGMNRLPGDACNHQHIEFDD